jgi:signal transduction histidine kinase
MIMMLTSSPRAQECADALQKACDEQVHVVTSVRSAMAQLRTREFTVLVIDQNILDPDPLAIETMLRHSQTAIPVYVNFALYGAERVLREVQVALRRAQTEKVAAMRAATTAVRNELRNALTGILMSSELALAVPSVPDAAQAKMRSVYELAQSMRKQLDAGC